MNEALQSPRPIEAIYDELEQLEPKPIRDFVPADAEGVKHAFLTGEIRNPQHSYPKLEAINFGTQQASIGSLRDQLRFHPEMPPRHTEAYTGLADNYIKKSQLMAAAARYKAAEGDEAEEAAEAFMRLNVELYGAPDEGTYHSLLHDAKVRFEAMGFHGQAATLRDEFIALLPEVDLGAERFKPDVETVALVQRAVDTIYGKWNRHIPQRDEKYTAKEIVQAFEAIIHEEFGESASGWTVVLSDSVAINVVASDKVIKVPESRKPVSWRELRALAVHELGVHMMRSIMGGNLDVHPLRVGLPEYGDSEEGLAKVLEMTVKGDIKEPGVPYYIAIGAALVDGKDFRGVHELMWRYNALGTIKPEDDEAAVEDKIAKAKDFAYRQTHRVFRGTDDLPWCKDLSYYNGTEKVWKYIETYGHDIHTLLLLFMGKADPAIEQHKRVLYASRTVV